MVYLCMPMALLQDTMSEKGNTSTTLEVQLREGDIYIYLYRYASGLRSSAPPQGVGQIFKLLPSPPQGRNACAYAYTSSTHAFVYVCSHMNAHV